MKEQCSADNCNICNYVDCDNFFVREEKKMLFKEKEVTVEIHRKLLSKTYELDTDAEETARLKKMRILYPNHDEIFIDIDSDHAFTMLKERVAKLINCIECFGYANIEKPFWTVYPSKSGLPHRHVILKFEGSYFDTWQRIALQFMLGSDYIKEALSTMEMMVGVKKPVYFFEPSVYDPEEIMG